MNDATTTIPAHALHGQKNSGLHEDMTYHLPAGAHHYVGADKYSEWEKAAEVAGAKLEWHEVWGVPTCFAKTADGRDVGRFKPGYCAHGHLLANAAGEPPEAPLATIRRHAESHRALAGSDAYSAQEAPRLEAALAAVAELIEAADFTADLLHEYGAPTRPQRQEVIGRLRTAVARMQAEPVEVDAPPAPVTLKTFADVQSWLLGLKVGDEVEVWQAMGRQPERAAVERLTTTQLVVGGERFRRTGDLAGYRVGDRDGSSTRRWLRPVGSA